MKTRVHNDTAFPPLFEPNRVGWCPLGGGIMFLGPERPEYPMGMGPYTGETLTYRGYTLRRRNQWREVIQRWGSETSVSVAGPGDDCPALVVDRRWEARVAGVTADGETPLEALDEAWAAAEFEDQLRHLEPPDVAP